MVSPGSSPGPGPDFIYFDSGFCSGPTPDFFFSNFYQASPGPSLDFTNARRKKLVVVLTTWEY